MKTTHMIVWVGMIAFCAVAVTARATPGDEFQKRNVTSGNAQVNGSPAAHTGGPAGKVVSDKVNTAEAEKVLATLSLINVHPAKELSTEILGLKLGESITDFYRRMSKLGTTTLKCDPVEEFAKTLGQDVISEDDWDIDKYEKWSRIACVIEKDRITNKLVEKCTVSFVEGRACAIRIKLAPSGSPDTDQSAKGAMRKAIIAKFGSGGKGTPAGGSATTGAAGRRKTVKAGTKTKTDGATEGIWEATEGIWEARKENTDVDEQYTDVSTEGVDVRVSKGDELEIIDTTLVNSAVNAVKARIAGEKKQAEEELKKAATDI